MTYDTYVLLHEGCVGVVFPSVNGWGWVIHGPSLIIEDEGSTQFNPDHRLSREESITDMRQAITIITGKEPPQDDPVRSH